VSDHHKWAICDLYFCVGFRYLLFCVIWIQALVDCKLEICKALEIPTEQFELSMGMSGDFEQAVCDINIYRLPRTIKGNPQIQV
jgi:hypothetical protein